MHLSRIVYFAAFVAGAVAALGGPHQAVANALSAPPVATAVGLPKASPEQLALREELEQAKLQAEIANADRDLGTSRGWINFFFQNGPILIAVLGGIAALARYLWEKRRDRREREEERFEGVVKSLGSEHLQERIGAAVLLPGFLTRYYRRFHKQVFDLAAGNLKMAPPADHPPNPTSAKAPDSSGSPAAGATPLAAARAAPSEAGTERLEPVPAPPDPFSQVLVQVFREALPKARRTLKNLSPEESDQRLDASGARLNGAFLAGADLEHVWLRSAILNGANLKGAHINRVNLEESSLRGAYLNQSDIVLSNLQKCNMEGAHLEAAIISGSSLEGTSLAGAHMPRVRIGSDAGKEGRRRTIMAGVNFAGADLTEARFEEVEFGAGSKVKLHEAASLKGARFLNVSGLAPRQIDLCKRKGATFESDEPAHPESQSTS